MKKYSVYTTFILLFPRCRFLDVVTQQFGSVAATTVRNFNSEQYPLLLVVMKNRSALEVCSVLQGQSNPSCNNSNSNNCSSMALVNNTGGGGGGSSSGSSSSNSSSSSSCSNSSSSSNSVIVIAEVQEFIALFLPLIFIVIETVVVIPFILVTITNTTKI